MQYWFQITIEIFGCEIVMGKNALKRVEARSESRRMLVRVDVVQYAAAGFRRSEMGLHPIGCVRRTALTSTVRHHPCQIRLVAKLESRTPVLAVPQGTFCAVVRTVGTNRARTFRPPSYARIRKIKASAPRDSVWKALTGIGGTAMPSTALWMYGMMSGASPAKIQIVGNVDANWGHIGTDWWL
ncbi:hypothetical protein K438DRAFT_1946405 [Mycena galopus ATCC 62051]|nr:hypothetical protein K438DRAFT_1946405 [Mycena galopus ATCC 62051]